MSNAGRYAVGIGTGAASGAGIGAFAGPIGAVIGGGVGALGGALSTLFQNSEEAKERNRIREALLRQKQEQAANDWEKRFASITGIGNDPMYVAMGYKPYDEGTANQEVDDYLAGAMPEREPNYGQLAQSAMQLGGTVGGLARQSAAQQKLDELIQTRRNGQAQAQGNPWGAYANPDDPWGFY